MIVVYWAGKIEEKFEYIAVDHLTEGMLKFRSGTAFVGSNSITIHGDNGDARLIPYSTVEFIDFVKGGVE